MKSAKILVSAVLIPALLVASDDSVQKLMRKPRYGRARINFADGTQATGTVSRVTTQFLTLREVDTCRNLELAQIASVKWVPNQDGSLEEGLAWLAVAVILSPVWVPMLIASPFVSGGDSLVDGKWKAISPAPDGVISRIEGNYWGWFVQRSVAVERGRYDLVGQDLHLVYDGSGLMETIPLQFDCESLLLGDQELSTGFSADRAQAPIVGRWYDRVSRSTWEFAASGTFEKRITESQLNGQIVKIKGGVHVKWLGPGAKPDEDWGIRTKGHHLSLRRAESLRNTFAPQIKRRPPQA